jgi:hypothetical protein
LVIRKRRNERSIEAGSRGKEPSEARLYQVRQIGHPEFGDEMPIIVDDDENLAEIIFTKTRERIILV